MSKIRPPPAQIESVSPCRKPLIMRNSLKRVVVVLLFSLIGADCYQVDDGKTMIDEGVVSKKQSDQDRKGLLHSTSRNLIKNGVGSFLQRERVEQQQESKARIVARLEEVQKKQAELAKEQMDLVTQLLNEVAQKEEDGAVAMVLPCCVKDGPRPCRKGLNCVDS